MSAPLPGREHYPDDQPFCVRSCGRPATVTVRVGAVPSGAFLRVVDPSDVGAVDDLEWCCEVCAPQVRAAVERGTYDA